MGKAKAPTVVDHNFRPVQTELESYLEYWKSRLGLEHWVFKYQFIPSAHEKNPTTTARVFPLWQYRRATFDFFLPTIQEEDHLERETMVIHELLHCVVNPCIHDKLDASLEECVVVDLAKAFLRMKYPKRSF